MALGHFLLGSHNLMVTTLWLMCEVALGMQWSRTFSVMCEVALSHSCHEEVHAISGPEGTSSMRKLCQSW
jgi:hypothetical protein